MSCCSLQALLMLMADLDVRAGRIQDAAAHLREGLQAAIPAGDSFHIHGRQRPVVLARCCAPRPGGTPKPSRCWAALDVQLRQQGLSAAGPPGDARRREEALRKARQALGPGRVRAAEERGAAMSLDTAAEYALMLAAPGPPARPRRRARGWEAQRPGTGTGHPGRPGPHRRPDRRPAVHQRPHRPLAPGPDPGQDRLPPPRRPDPPGPAGWARLTARRHCPATGRA